MWIALLKLIHLDVFDMTEGIKKESNDVKLKSFLGENVADCCTKISEIANCLKATETFGPELLCSIACVFQQSSEHHFQDWAMKKNHEVLK